jgi:hypothetical protein
MNDRIAELAEQATKYANRRHTQWVGPEEMNPNWEPCRDTKFAELIVMHCVNICFNSDGSARRIGLELLNEFGIKE